MAGTLLPKGLFFAIVLAAVARCIREFPLLPNRLASHFASSGVPSSWLTKSGFFALYAGLIVLAASIGFLAPRMVVKTPTSRMNLPHKEYWLAPEHRAETFDFFEKSFAWYGCIFLLLEVSTMEIVIRANLRTPPQLPIGPIVLLISAFALLNFACVIAIFRRFSRPR
jgi:uncharacterized membrane protein